MIFVMSGTDKFQFNRLFQGIDEALKKKIIKDKVFAQIGSTDYCPQNFVYKRWLSFSEVCDWIKKAEIVVTHGGAGSILLSLQMGKIPIVFPKEKKFKEIIDNHQVLFTQKLSEIGKIVAAFSIDDLIEKIISYNKLVVDKNQENYCGKKNLTKKLKEIVDSLEIKDAF